MIIHFIISGETLESIAEEIHLENPQYLKEYHNRYCAKEDYIYDQLIPRKKLLIPEMDKIQEYNSRNDAPFKKVALNPEITFAPEHKERKYRVTITETHEKEKGDSKSSDIAYSVTLQWVKKDLDTHIFHLSKDDFYTDNESKMSGLAIECIQSLNPFQITTDSKGEILNISLLPGVIKNFGKAKERLADLFPDPYASRYIEDFEYVISDEKLFSERMKQDTFLRIYFAGLRNDFKNGKSYFRQSISDENIPVIIQQTIEDEDYTDEVDLLLNLSKSEAPDLVEYDGTYTITLEDGMIKKAWIKYSVFRFGVKYTTRIAVDELF
ncbi:hypothetical protein N6B72_12755 [Chryseobacterium soli]|uniref:hypothetical protein n=1 Tax=Chryseobacterium soli TaxID=445961 RepID=UPI002952A68D|nr:hypothetical protein [Chryseobacterium soli]MDV7697793.1 hypothetical protein [Chryseobacterium soli]